MSESLGLIAFGIVLGSCGLLALREYRKLFFENPRAAMTFEVLLQIAQVAGGLGYLGVTLLLCSLVFILGGAAAVLLITIDSCLFWLGLS